MNLNTDKDKVSYIIGQDIAHSIAKDDMDLNVEILAESIKLYFAKDNKPLLSQEEVNRVMQSWQNDMQKKQEAKNHDQALENNRKGKEFLENNRKQDNVIQTPSGLQYTILQEGSGPKPKSTDTVKVHYHGTLLNGTVFDSSVDRNEPISFPLQQVIAGWTEGLQLMNVGSKFRFYIPSNLAYGDRPVGNIPSGSTLIFEVELLAIQ